MLRGYRSVVAAFAGLSLLVLALGIGAYFGALYSPDKKQYQTVSGDRASGAEYRGPSQSLADISGVPSFAERAIANPQPTSGEDHEKRDLAAQESMSVWAFWMMLVTAFSAIVTTIGTVFLYKQISLTREAVKDTGKATEAMLEANRIAASKDRPFVVVVTRKASHKAGPMKNLATGNMDNSFNFLWEIGFANEGVGIAYPRYFTVEVFASSDPGRVLNGSGSFGTGILRPNVATDVITVTAGFGGAARDWKPPYFSGSDNLNFRCTAIYTDLSGKIWETRSAFIYSETLDDGFQIRPTSVSQWGDRMLESWEPPKPLHAA